MSPFPISRVRGHQLLSLRSTAVHSQSFFMGMGIHLASLPQPLRSHWIFAGHAFHGRTWPSPKSPNRLACQSSSHSQPGACCDVRFSFFFFSPVTRLLNPSTASVSVLAVGVCTYRLCLQATLTNRPGEILYKTRYREHVPPIWCK